MKRYIVAFMFMFMFATPAFAGEPVYGMMDYTDCGRARCSVAEQFTSVDQCEQVYTALFKARIKNKIDYYISRNYRVSSRESVMHSAYYECYQVSTGTTISKRIETIPVDSITKERCPTSSFSGSVECPSGKYEVDVK